MKQRIGDTKRVVHLTREQNRIGCTFVCTIGISEPPEEYGGYCETDHRWIRTETETHTRTAEIVRCHRLVKISDTGLRIFKPQVRAQDDVPFDLHICIIEVFG
jgi:hypothetical protein